MTRVTLVLKTNEGGMWVVPQLLSLRSAGADVTAVIPAGDGRLRRALDAQGIRVVEAPFDFSFGPRLATLSGLLRLRRVISRTRPNVVFYHLYASALAARLTTLGTGVRRVHMVAGPLYLESRTIRAVERFLMRLDSTLIAGSEYTARLYRELGLPASRVMTVPYGVDLKKFSPSQGDRSALGLEDDAFVVVMVAYVYAPKSAVHPGVGIKGHEVLLRAWAQVVAAEPRARLLLVGGGFGSDGEAHRQRLMRDFAIGADPTVMWLDQVEDVRPYYALADVSVSPSLSENHGAALEASASGVPSVVSDAGALPEAVTHATGWVVPAGSVGSLAGALLAAAAERRSGALVARASAARALMMERFDLRQCTEAVRDGVLGDSTSDVSRTRPRVAAFSEQRSWLRGKDILGRKSLGIVSALTERAEVELTVRVGRDEGDGVPLASGVHARPLVAGGNGLAGSMYELVRNVARVVAAVRRADVVYADQPGVVGGLGLLVGRLLGRPLVVNVVGDSAESVHPDVVPGARGRLAHVLLPAVQRWAASHATVTNYVTRRVLQERYPPRRSRQTFSLSTAEPLGPARPRSFRRGELSIVTVGSLEQPYKGVRELIEAIQMLRTADMDVSLTVVGEGRLRAELQAVAEALLPGSVRFTGQLYGAELHEELGRHDMFVLASWTEGLPRALAEAMADGMPCVATDVGGVGELLSPQWTVPPRDPAALADAVRRLASDPIAWDESVNANREAACRLFARRDSMDDLVSAVVASAAPLGNR